MPSMQVPNCSSVIVPFDIGTLADVINNVAESRAAVDILDTKLASEPEFDSTDITVEVADNRISRVPSVTIVQDRAG